MTIPHNQLTGADLHEPKGIESADSGDIYIADGNGSGNWSPPADTGIWQHVTTLIPTAVTSVTSPDLSAYRTLRITVQGLIPTVTGQLTQTISSDGTNFNAIQGQYGSRYRLSSAFVDNQNFVDLSNNINIQTINGWSGEILLYNFNQPLISRGHWHGHMSASDNAVWALDGHYYYAGNTAHTHLRWQIGGQTFTGNIVIEGMA